MRVKRRRLHLQQQVETKNSHGEAVISWSTVATTWARPKMLWGSEGFTADQVNAQKQINWYITAASEWSSIDNTWRAQDSRSGRNYEIQSVVMPEQRAYQTNEIELICSESERDDA